MDVNNNVWLERAIGQLYLMRDEHKLLLKDFDVLRRTVFDLREDVRKLRSEVDGLRKLVDERDVGVLI